ncbi:hypothetical protein H6F86_28770 [Phormidium sp. FACHB-592]|uniref:Trypsin-co-occurring domain-containing protein n=1 Tax=Stenomitos frigidus AS-A4 TaxID=2933935 RepID=A0ABV0KDC3_9CYAN|nr:CU044_2847 family protein [Phormidium sp. FACHB-592]MBD2077812.1 hypothetical protein [Phormidium sp. FACHB-592]
MNTSVADENSPILVEFAIQPGIEEVGINIPSGTELTKRSAQAISNAMDTIRSMACYVIATMNSLPERPSQVEVQFGIKLNIEGNAVVAKAIGESNISVKLVWVTQIDK